MVDGDVLAKTNRINLLFDLYRELLTDKQQTFMQLYFYEDWSLGEIAEKYGVSRQAINEHIKRGEQALEDYERKLRLLQQDEQRRHVIAQMKDAISQLDQPHRMKLNELVQQLGGESNGF